LSGGSLSQSGYVFTNTTHPRLIEMADERYGRAAAEDPAIRAGLHMALGTLTNRAVADTFAMPCQEG
jgi:alanine dehydrogenase